MKHDQAQEFCPQEFATRQKEVLTQLREAAMSREEQRYKTQRRRQLRTNLIIFAVSVVAIYCGSSLIAKIYSDLHHEKAIPIPMTADYVLDSFKLKTWSEK